MGVNMKRKMLLPCLSSLVLCVALLCIGVYAVSINPKTHDVWGTISVLSKAKEIQLRAYYDSTSTPLTDYINVLNGGTFNIPNSNKLRFDVSNRYNLDPKPTITLIIGIKNMEAGELGAYFGNGNTEEFYSAKMGKTTVEEVVKVQFPEYTSVASGMETYLTLTISLEKLLDESSSVTLDLVLNIDDPYNPPTAE